MTCILGPNTVFSMHTVNSYFLNKSVSQKLILNLTLTSPTLCFILFSLNQNHFLFLHDERNTISLKEKNIKLLK